MRHKSFHFNCHRESHLNFLFLPRFFSKNRFTLFGKRSSRNYSGIWRKTPGRLFGVGLVRFYQLTLSGFIGQHCRHLPTCSEYAYEAIARHGLWAGGFMSLFRVIRCGPCGSHGFDPVPEILPEHCHWYQIWRYWRLKSPAFKCEAVFEKRSPSPKIKRKGEPQEE